MLASRSLAETCLNEMFARGSPSPPKVTSAQSHGIFRVADEPKIIEIVQVVKCSAFLPRVIHRKEQLERRRMHVIVHDCDDLLGRLWPMGPAVVDVSSPPAFPDGAVRHGLLQIIPLGRFVRRHASPLEVDVIRE